ncbi:uncharacterized protein LOC141904807 [Tubulanus polymorphus]|uniref:uncharacterized protein LOC141904807 n=1 Tax=Tubulanus polymorphus TaxID=672921 RepID=UPI003DA3C519
MTMLQVDQCYYETFLLELTVERNRSVELFPCFFEAYHALQTEAAKHRNAVKIEYIFKVTAEEKVLVVVKVLEVNIVEALIDAIGQALRGGITFSVKCVPLRGYDGFAHDVLGLEQTVVENGQQQLSGDHLYWWEFSIEFKDMSFENFVANWKEEAAAELGLTSSMELNMDVYKVVAERKVHCFINTPNQEELDLMTFQLPIMKSMGNQVQIHCKSIQHFSDFLNENYYEKTLLKRFLHWCHHFKGSW